MADNDTLLRAAELPAGLLDRIVAHLDPLRVILFGSRVGGEVHRDSDWDLLVIVDDNAPRERINWRALYETHRGIPAPIDLIPCRESTFNDRADIIGSLPWIAMTKGVVVYERSKG